MSALAAARRICERSGWTLTNLQLQKIMYLVQMKYLGEKGARLFNGTFEAWDYGPVIPMVYSQAKMFGRGAIKGGFFGVGSVNDEVRAKELDTAYDQLSGYSPGQLVNITHWSEGAWAKNYIPGVRGVPIPDADIIEEYRERLQRIQHDKSG